MVCFFGKSMDFLPSPIVAKSASGSNSRVLFEIVARLITIFSSSGTPELSHTAQYLLMICAILRMAQEHSFPPNQTATYLLGQWCRGSTYRTRWATFGSNR